MKVYYVYILTNYARTVFYVGITGNLYRRIWEHKNGKGGKFTGLYNCNLLMFYEEYYEPLAAINREKNLKNWHRGWKINLIRKNNPEMIDLAEKWYCE